MHRKEASYPQRRRTPSFSSTLLDAIYNSIDDSKTDNHVNQQPSLNLKHTFNEKTNNVKERMNLRQAVMIEDWMEKHSTTSSSSESIFSSSETDTTTTTTYDNKQRYKPLIHSKQQKQDKPQPQSRAQAREGGFARTKLRALKIYGELNQKVRQPISPGSKIANFLSSIFSSENVKKAKMCYVGAVEDVRFESHNNNKSNKSPCFSSSVSSFSRRSCMTKTPSSSRSNNGVKRSVRFYPVSVILGEDNSSKQQQYSYHHNEPLPLSSSSVRTRSCSIKELKKNKKKNSVMSKGKNGTDFRELYDDDDDEEDEDDDDALSCSSSELFELDHLIGAQRYQEELPVYETTSLETNKAIANGMRF